MTVNDYLSDRIDIAIMSKKQCFLMLILLALPVIADAPPPIEFWEYMEEFSADINDNTGEVFDAIDFAANIEKNTKTNSNGSESSLDDKETVDDKIIPVEELL